MEIRLNHCLVLIFFFSFVFSQNLTSGVKPVFDFFYASWNATDIIFAHPFSSDPNLLEVKQVYFGDLAIGEKIFNPEIGSFTRNLLQGTQNIQVILFLKDRSKLFCNQKTIGRIKILNDSERWLPAHYGKKFIYSAMWFIDGCSSYFFHPGPANQSVIGNSSRSKEMIEHDISDLVNQKKSFAKAAFSPDTEERRNGLEQFFKSKFVCWVPFEKDDGYFVRACAKRALESGYDNQLGSESVKGEFYYLSCDSGGAPIPAFSDFIILRGKFILFDGSSELVSAKRAVKKNEPLKEFRLYRTGEKDAKISFDENNFNFHPIVVCRERKI